MAMYEVTMKDRSVERVEQADAYQQEGPMTTFFQTDQRHRAVDSWSTRLASFRTSEVLIIRRRDAEPARAEVAPVAPLASVATADAPSGTPFERGSAALVRRPA